MMAHILIFFGYLKISLDREMQKNYPSCKRTFLKSVQRNRLVQNSAQRSVHVSLGAAA